MAIKTKTVKVQIDGIEYVLEVERAIQCSVLKHANKYYPGTYYKYNNMFWLLVKDSQNKFNLINLTQWGLYNTWIDAVNGSYLNEQEWTELVTRCRYDEMVPVRLLHREA
jgi:hypothetical protein